MAAATGPQEAGSAFGCAESGPASEIAMELIPKREITRFGNSPGTQARPAWKTGLHTR